MLSDKDRIFTNLYGFRDWGLDAALLAFATNLISAPKCSPLSKSST